MADAITVREAELDEQIAQLELARRELLVNAATPGDTSTVDSDGLGVNQGRLSNSQRLAQIEATLKTLKQEKWNLCVSTTGQVAAPLTATIGGELSEYHGDPSVIDE